MSGILKNKKFLTIDKKNQIISELKKGASLRQLALKYGVGKSTISDIKKKQRKLQSFFGQMECALDKRKTMKRAEYEEMEKKLYSWFVKKRQQNVPISTDLLQQKARELFHEIYGDSEDDVPLSVLQENNAEPLNNFIDLLVNIAPDVYSQREVNEWIDDEDVETNYDSDNEHNEIQEENVIIELEQEVKHSEAVSSFNLCIKYAEENNFSALDIMKLRKLRENAVENKNNAIKQVTIDRFISQR